MSMRLVDPVNIGVVNEKGNTDGKASQAEQPEPHDQSKSAASNLISTSTVAENAGKDKMNESSDDQSLSAASGGTCDQKDQVTVKQMMDAAHAIVMQSVNAIEEEEEEIDWLQAELEELSRVCHLLQEEKASEIRSGRQALLRAGQGLTTESEFDEHRERMHFAFHRVEDKSVEWLEALTHLIELRRALWKKWLGTTQKAMEELAQLRAMNLPLLGEADQEIILELLDEFEGIGARDIAKLKQNIEEAGLMSASDEAKDALAQNTKVVLITDDGVEEVAW